MIFKELEKHKIIAIIRGVYDEPLLRTVQALYDGGIRLAEVTFEQTADGEEKTASAIAMLERAFKGKMIVGAGTVLEFSQLEKAYNAGAKFIVSPNINADIIKRTKELGLLSIPGAMTPTEILQAENFGADYIKIFPAGILGETYIKNIKAPFPRLKFVATAGITEDNISAFISAGYTAAGVSERLVDKQLIESGDFVSLSDRAKQFVKLLK